MRYQRFLPWLAIFAREWFAPRLATAFAVATVSAVLFSVDLPELNGVVRERFERIFAPSKNPYIFGALIFFGAVFILALWGRHYWSGKSRIWYYMDASVPGLAMVLNWILGIVLLPMVVSITAFTVMLGGHGLQLGLFGIMAASFVFVGGCLHYAGGQDGQPRHAIAFAVSPPQEEGMNVDYEEFHHNVVTRLGEVMSHVRWHRGPSDDCETSDRHISVTLPIYLHISAWRADEIAHLNLFLSAIELEWRELKYVVTRSISPGFDSAGQ